MLFKSFCSKIIKNCFESVNLILWNEEIEQEKKWPMFIIPVIAIIYGY